MISGLYGQYEVDYGSQVEAGSVGEISWSVFELNPRQEDRLHIEYGRSVIRAENETAIIRRDALPEMAQKLKDLAYLEIARQP